MSSCVLFADYMNTQTSLNWKDPDGSHTDTNVEFLKQGAWFGANSYSRYGTSVSDMELDNFSIMTVIKNHQIPGVNNHIMGVYGASPYWYLYFRDNNKIRCNINIGILNSNVKVGWNYSNPYAFIVVTFNRSGNITLYVKSPDGWVTNTLDISSESAMPMTPNQDLTVGQIGNDPGWDCNAVVPFVRVYKGKLLTFEEIVQAYQYSVDFGYI